MLCVYVSSCVYIFAGVSWCIEEDTRFYDVEIK